MALDAAGESKPFLRLASWLLEYTTRPAKNIIIDADINDWCEMLSLDEKQFAEALNKLTEAKCIECEVGKVKLIDRYGLQTFVSRNRAQN